MPVITESRRHNLSVAANMHRVGPAFLQHSRDQQVPMANEWILFAAHGGNPKSADARFEPFDSLEKPRGLSYQRIKHSSVAIVKLGFDRPSSQLFA